MVNCLKTQLKEAISNDSLDKLGEIKLVCSLSDPTIYICADTANKVLLKATGGTLNGNAEMYAGTEGNDSYTISGSSAEPVLITANPKYNITKLSSVIPTKGISDLAYLGLQYFYFDNATFDASFVSKYKIDINGFKDFNDKSKLRAFSCLIPSAEASLSNIVSGNIESFSGFTSIVVVNFDNTNVEGDVESLASLTTLKRVLFTNCAGITGDISNLGTLTSLNTLGAHGSTLYGTLESFVQAQRSSGRTTESTGITITYGLGNVTFNGQEIAYSGSSRTLTWTASTITFAGTTINA